MSYAIIRNQKYTKEQNHSKEIKINTMYTLIQRLNNEKNELLKILRQYGILNKINNKQK